MPNRNPYGPRDDVTISRITTAEVRVDGGPWQPASADDGAFDGYTEAFSFVTRPLIAGSHVVEARAVNTERNVDSTPASDVLVTQSSLCSAVNLLAPYVNRTTLFVSASVVGSAAGVELWYSRNGSGYALYGTDTGSPWEWQVDVKTFGGDGLYRFYSIALDSLGNREPPPASSDASTTVDTAPPFVRIAAPRSSEWFKFSTVEANWTASDVGSGLDRFVVALDSNPPVAESGRNHTFPSLSEGSHQVSVIAYDRAGISGTASVRFGVDWTAPVVSLTGPVEGQLVRESAVRVEWNGTDSLSGIAYFDVRLDSGPFIRVGNSTTTYAFTGVSDGPHTVTVVAWDASGNPRNASVTFRVDASWISAVGPWGWDAIGLLVSVTAVALLLVWRRRKRRKSTMQTGVSPHEERTLEEAGPEDR